MIRLAAVIILIWALVVIEASLLTFAAAPLQILRPSLWLIFIFSIKSSFGRSLAAAAAGGLLLDFWSVLPFGIVLASTVAAVIVSRELVIRWLSHRPALASFSVCVAGLTLFMAARDALGSAAGLFGADSGWVAEPLSIEIQIRNLAFNIFAVAILFAVVAAFGSTLRRSLRFKQRGPGFVSD